MKKLIQYLDTIWRMLSLISPEDMVSMIIGNHTDRYIQGWVKRLNRGFFEFFSRLDNQNRKRFLDLLQAWKIGGTLEEVLEKQGQEIEVHKPGEYLTIDHSIAFNFLYIDFLDGNITPEFREWFQEYPLVETALGSESEKKLSFTSEMFLPDDMPKKNIIVVIIR